MSKNISEAGSYRKIALCLFLLILTLTLSALFVNTHDDFYLPETVTDLHGSWAYTLRMGNGRYVGNFLGTYLTIRYVPNLVGIVAKHGIRGVVKAEES